MFNSSFMSVDHTRLLFFIVCLMHTMEESNEYQGQFESFIEFHNRPFYILYFYDLNLNKSDDAVIRSFSLIV
jgi:hypothetical protein